MKNLLFLLLFVASNVSAVTYYVRPDGNDNFSGLSHQQAWQTINRVNTFNFQQGDDVYFESNGTWFDDLTIDWSGTSGNRAVVGAYYWDGAQEVIGVSGTKPTFEGNFAGTNDLPILDTPAANPSSRFGALIAIGTTNLFVDYVTVQDFRLINSAGRGVAVWGVGSQFNTVQRVYTRHTAMSGIATRGTYTTVYNNELTQSAPLRFYDSATYTSAPGCLVSQGYYNVIENNNISECWQEGILVSKIPGRSFNIVRGNIIQCRKGALYPTNASDVIVENNLVYGDKRTGFTIGTNPPTPVQYVDVNGWPRSGLVARSEEFTTGGTDRVYFRNNLVTNTYSCFETGNNAGAIAQGWTTTPNYYGNICAGNFANAPTGGGGATGVFLTAKNNVFIYSVSSGTSTDCNYGATKANFDGNYWDNQPTDTDCRSGNDLYGGLVLNKTTNWYSTTIDNPPIATDFQPANDIVSRQTTWLNTETFPSTEYVPELVALLAPGCAFDTTEWSDDYYCNSRTAATDFGPFHLSLGNPIAFDEAVSGDLLSFLPVNQQTNVGTLDVGKNTVTGNTAISAGFRDSADAFNFTVPANHTLQSATLNFTGVTGYKDIKLIIRKINDIDIPLFTYSESSDIFFDMQVTPEAIFGTVLPDGEGIYNVFIPAVYGESTGDLNLDYVIDLNVTSP